MFKAPNSVGKSMISIYASGSKHVESFLFCLFLMCNIFKIHNKVYKLVSFLYVEPEKENLGQKKKQKSIKQKSCGIIRLNVQSFLYI